MDPDIKINNATPLCCLCNFVEIKRFSEDYTEILLTSENKVRWVKIRPESLSEIKSKINPIKECDTPNKPGIYLLTCLIEDKKSYNGEGVNLKKRIAQHRCSEHNNAKDEVITKAIRKYGWHNFEIRILEIFDEGTKTKFELLDLEEAYIAHYNLLNKDIGYNVLARGTDRTGFKHSEEAKKKMSVSRSGENHTNFGKTFSEETLQKMSEAQLGAESHLFGKRGESHPRFGKKMSAEARYKISKATAGKNNPNYGKTGDKSFRYGKTHTKETCDKMSKANLGKKLSPEHIAKMSEARRIPVNQLDKETGEIIKVWASAAEAGRVLLCSSSDISRVCSGKQMSTHGFYWSYADFDLALKYRDMQIELRKFNRKIPVNQLDKITGVLIKTWDSATDAAKYLGTRASDICSVCMGIQKSAHNFKWSYAKNEK